MNPCPKPDALRVQTGGDHYKKLAIQPMEFSMANHWDSCAHTILKYVTRHRDKNGRQDLEKALHCVDLREALWHSRHLPLFEVISISDYCLANKTPVAEASALSALSSWVTSNSTRCRLQLITAIHNLVSEYDRVDARTLEGFNETRADIIGQNGNDGLAYSTNS